MSKSPRLTLLYMVLVFGSGSLVGAVAHRLYVTTTVAASVTPKTPAQARQDFLAKFRTRVGVDEAQVTRINAALDDAKRKYGELDLQNKPLRAKIDEERVQAILAALNPTQQQSFLKWRDEVRAKRKAKADAEKAAQQTAAPQTR